MLAVHPLHLAELRQDLLVVVTRSSLNRGKMSSAMKLVTISLILASSTMSLYMSTLPAEFDLLMVLSFYWSNMSLTSPFLDGLSKSRSC